MARFYGEVGGQARTEASRMGNAWSGLYGHIRGWHVGAAVRMHADGDNDECRIYATGGSAGYSETFLGDLQQSPNGIVFTPSRELRDAILKAEGKRPNADVPSSVVIR